MKFEIKERVIGEGDWEKYNRGNDQLLLNGKIIGCCTKTDHNSFVIEVIEICDEKLRGKGYGTVFVKIYEVLAKERKFKRIEADVDPLGKFAKERIKFWEKKCGFIKDKNKSSNNTWVYYRDL